MTTESVENLLDDVLLDAREYLPRLKDGLSEVAKLFQEGREGEAINLFIECIEGLEWLNSVLEGMAAFRDHMVVEEGEADLNIRYRNSIKELLGAWDNRDMVLISDLIEFEIIPVIEGLLDKISPEEN